jgi:hypothetical protein
VVGFAGVRNFMFDRWNVMDLVLVMALTIAEIATFPDGKGALVQTAAGLAH